MTLDPEGFDTKVIICYTRTGYNLNVMRQSACLVIKTITVNNFAARFK